MTEPDRERARYAVTDVSVLGFGDFDKEHQLAMIRRDYGPESNFISLRTDGTWTMPDGTVIPLGTPLSFGAVEHPFWVARFATRSTLVEAP